MSKDTTVTDGINSPALNDEIEIQDVEYEEYEGGEGEEEILEEEVTDDEDNGPSEAPSSAMNVESPAASRTTETPSKPKTPGRVAPSKEVKEMGIECPEVRKKRVEAKLFAKDPFPTFGDWSPSKLAEIEISFPISTGKNETTNELTRSFKPEVRYWKAPIVFKHGNFTSVTIRFNNVHIPCHTGKGYGSSYVYLCLPRSVGEAFAEAGKRRASTKVGENSLVPDTERWWKIANNVENASSVINQTTKKFHTKSLETTFDATTSGISCCVILSFKFKAATTEKEALRPTTARTVSVEIVRGFINEVDINVQMPTRISREKPRKDPIACSADVATDSLLKRLAELGLWESCVEL